MLNQDYNQVEKTVFLITYGRSGSTLLQNMLNALPNHILRGENANILAPMVQSWQDLRLSEQAEKMRIAQRPSAPHQPWFGYERIDPECLGQDMAYAFLKNVLRPEPSTKVIGFKEIRWHTKPDLFLPMLYFLKKFMPEPRFIFNTRNHHEVAKSGWWKTMDHNVVHTELERAEVLYASWLTRHPECSLEMHYNDYIMGSDAWKPFFEFLDMPFDRKMVEKILDFKLTHMKRAFNKDVC